VCFGIARRQACGTPRKARSVWYPISGSGPDCPSLTNCGNLHRFPELLSSKPRVWRTTCSLSWHGNAPLFHEVVEKLSQSFTVNAPNMAVQQRSSPGGCVDRLRSPLKDGIKRLHDHRHRSGRKTLVQLAKSSELDVKRKPTWGMSGVECKNPPSLLTADLS